MPRFSLKQLLGSMALVAVGVCMASQIEYFRQEMRLIDVVLWFSIWPIFVAAVLNLWNVPILRGAKIGFAFGMFTAILWTLVEIIHNRS